MIKTKIKSSLRNEVFRRDDYTCLWCGKSVADGVKLHADHVIPEAFGGNTSYENLGTLCETCNTSKGSEYFGSYLLTTLLKLKDIDKHIVEEDHTKNFRVSITFYKWIEQPQIYSKETLFHVGSMPEDYGMFIKEDEIHYKIKKSEVKRDAKIALKEKIRNYLFENQGFIEELEGRLIFRKRSYNKENNN